jgi:ribosome-binding factor A
VENFFDYPFSIFGFILKIMRRPERLAEVLREEITEIVGYELEDPRFLAQP